MLNFQLPNTVGVFFVLELFAVPFGYEGASAIMSRQWVRAIVAYLIAIPLAVGGLLALGIPIVGQSSAASIGRLLVRWLGPLSNPYLILLLLVLVLFWLARGRSTANQRTRLEAASINTAVRPNALMDTGQRKKLTPEQLDALASQLSALEQREVHVIRDNLPECADLALQIHTLFAQLGWHVPVIPSDKFYEPVLAGIRVRSKPDDKTAAAVRRILSEVLGIPVGEKIEAAQNMDWFEIEIGRMPL
jgi:hypothetical protein